MIDKDEAMEAPASWDDVEEFRALQTSGLLWLINTTVFHPRGFALGMVPGKDEGPDGPYYGWKLLGDGSEAWVMPADETTDECFRAAEAYFAAHRKADTHAA